METRTHSSQDRERREPDFVVDLPHVGRVREALKKLGIESEEGDRSKELGLVLLRLPNLVKEALPLCTNADLLTPFVLARVSSGLPGMPNTNEDLRLNLVMFAVRRAFAKDYGGWQPTIGKNREISVVEGVPHVGFGGTGDPAPINGAERLKALSIVFKDGRAPADQVRVGILDTVVVKRPELNAYLADPSYAIEDPRGEAYSLQGHGTFVAGLIAKRAPNAKLEVRKVLSDETATAYSWDVATKMVEFASRDDVKILNLSFVCPVKDGLPPLVLTRAVDLLSPRTTLVAAAGNHGNAATGVEQRVTPKQAMYPAAFDNVEAVGADTRDGTRAEFSPDLPWVNFMAPGVDVESTYLKGRVKLYHEPIDAPPVRFQGFATWSGTSFAAATFSGELARRMGNGESAEEAIAELQKTPQGGIRPFIQSNEIK